MAVPTNSVSFLFCVAMVLVFRHMFVYVCFKFKSVQHFKQNSAFSLKSAIAMSMCIRNAKCWLTEIFELMAPNW